MPFETAYLDTTEIGTLGSRSIYRLNSMLIYNEILPIRVPVGFQTDLASVPRIPIIFLFWGDRAHRPAVLHDYLYREDSKPLVTKDEADQTFFRAILCTEQKGTFKSWLKSYIIAIPMYLGVVWGGNSSYEKLRVGGQFIDWIEPVQ
jgi:hypothetical protein